MDAEHSLERGPVLLNKISQIIVLEQTAATLISCSTLIFVQYLIFITQPWKTSFAEVWCHQEECGAIRCWNCELPRVPVCMRSCRWPGLCGSLRNLKQLALQPDHWFPLSSGFYLHFLLFTLLWEEDLLVEKGPLGAEGAVMGSLAFQKPLCSQPSWPVLEVSRSGLGFLVSSICHLWTICFPSSQFHCCFSPTVVPSCDLFGFVHVLVLSVIWWEGRWHICDLPYLIRPGGSDLIFVNLSLLTSKMWVIMSNLQAIWRCYMPGI